NWFASGATPGRANSSNLPPAVTIATPDDGTVFPFKTPIELTANATDSDGAIREVTFFLDDAEYARVESMPFTVFWSNAPVGLHSILARAMDNRLGIVTSAPVQITISNHPPAVALVAPSAGATFTLPTNILLEATASDLDGFVTKVQFFANG